MDSLLLSSWWTQQRQKDEESALLPLDMLQAGVIWKHLTIPQRLRLRCVSRGWRDADPDAVCVPTQWIARRMPLHSWYCQWFIFLLEHDLHLLYPTMEFQGTVYRDYNKLPCHGCGTLVWTNREHDLSITPHGHPVNKTAFGWDERGMGEKKSSGIEEYDVDVFFQNIRAIHAREKEHVTRL